MCLLAYVFAACHIMEKVMRPEHASNHTVKLIEEQSEDDHCVLVGYSDTDEDGGQQIVLLWIEQDMLDNTVHYS